MNNAPDEGRQSPKVRTILLTDLCDSTELVERIGDKRAVELFQEHDRLVLELQQRWRGRLIDRSDGLLLLFERPIDGLGFAMDYLRGLHEIGKKRKLKLHARAGIHVGEVVTWSNSERAVASGAKMLEVEGLAKPIAARLMALARPDQILMSATAEALARRAARDLGTRGDQLLWRSHGRWRFKGIPLVQEVFEAGEIGVAPLRMPKPSAKAKRDLPLWRHPASLVAEFVVVVAIGIGIWMTMRSPPAIAFGERDWVVVADTENTDSNPLLDKSLKQALLVSLQQSRYVNIVPEMKIEQTLRDMQRDPASTRIDRKIGAELAVRDGAKVLLVPSVLDVGGQLRVTISIVDPSNGDTLLSIYHDGNGTQSLLDSVDAVTQKLRDDLGESLEKIKSTSRPLPDVATPSLEALKAYALGIDAQMSGQLEQAIDYFQQALAFDKNFAMAHLAMMNVYLSNAQSRKAVEELDRAIELKDRLSKRDQFYLVALNSYVRGDDRQALNGFRMLAKIYPDHFEALNKYLWLALSSGYYEEALKAGRQGLKSQNVYISNVKAKLALAELGVGDLKKAAQYFDEVEITQGRKKGYLSSLVMASKGNAQQALDMLDAATEGEKLQPSTVIARAAFLVQLGDSLRAEGFLQRQIDAAGQKTFVGRDFRFLLLSTKALRGDAHLAPLLTAYFAEVANAATDGPVEDRGDMAYLAAATCYLMQRYAPDAVSDSLLARLRKLEAVSGKPALLALMGLVNARQLIAEHRPQAALDLLKKQNSLPTLLQQAVVERDAYLALGDVQEAKRVSNQLSQSLHAAYADVTGAYSMQVLNVADSMSATSSEVVKANGQR